MSAKKIMKISTVILFIIFTVEAQNEEPVRKALFLEAAIRFIAWPEDRDSVNLPEKKNFVVGIFAHDQMVSYLKKTLSDRKVKDRDAKFLLIDSMAQIAGCDMVIIPDSQKDRIPEIYKIAKINPVLTVSDSPDLIRKGMILSLGIKKSRIICYINEQEAIKSRFKISHHLLQNSIIVNTQEKKS